MLCLHTESIYALHTAHLLHMYMQQAPYHALQICDAFHMSRSCSYISHRELFCSMALPGRQPTTQQ